MPCAFEPESIAMYMKKCGILSGRGRPVVFMDLCSFSVRVRRLVASAGNKCYIHHLRLFLLLFPRAWQAGTGRLVCGSRRLTGSRLA
jgi:hypothetical protein